MLKKLLIVTSIIISPITSQAGWLDAILDQAEAQIPANRAYATSVINQVDARQAQQSQLNQSNLVKDTIFTTSYLKTLDCTDLSVEAKGAQRIIDTAQSQATTTNQGSNLSKFAGLASSTLSAFSGQSETISKASQIASALTGQNQQVSTNTISQQSYDNAVANLDNISIYQKAKKCKI